MKESAERKERGDPAHFAPDFEKQPEPYGKPMSELLEAFANFPAGTTILDVAGGYGRYAIPLLKAGFDVTIIDIHTPSLAEAQRRRDKMSSKSTGKLTLIEADILQQDSPRIGKFDCVFSAGFLHHLTAKALQDCFLKMSTVLRKDGTIIFEFSTNKRRRYPSGEPILVGGDAEQNCSLEQGLKTINGLFGSSSIQNMSMDTVPLRIRQSDFWYDADVILAQGRKLK